MYKKIQLSKTSSLKDGIIVQKADFSKNAEKLIVILYL